MNKFFRSLLVVLFVFIACERAEAREYLLQTEAYLAFKPESVVLIVQFKSGSVVAVSASAQEMGSSLSSKNYVLGSILEIPSEADVFSLIFIAKGLAGEVKGFYLANQNKADFLELANAETELISMIEAHSARLDQMGQQHVEIKKSISDLRDEVRDDQNLLRLTNAQDKLRKVDGQKAALKRQTNHLKFLADKSQSQELPYNFTKRELELTSQLSELASVAILTESQEDNNQKLSDSEFEEMQRLIESTQGYYAEELEARLRGLEQRKSLAR